MVRVWTYEKHVGTFQWMRIASREGRIYSGVIERETILQPRAGPERMSSRRMWVTETWLQFVLTGCRNKHGRALRLGSCKSGALQEYCRFITFLSFLISLTPLRLPGVHLAGEMELFFSLFDFLVTGELFSFSPSLPRSHTLSFVV